MKISNPPTKKQIDKFYRDKKKQDELMRVFYKSKKEYTIKLDEAIKSSLDIPTFNEYLENKNNMGIFQANFKEVREELEKITKIMQKNDRSRS